MSTWIYNTFRSIFGYDELAAPPPAPAPTAVPPHVIPTAGTPPRGAAAAAVGAPSAAAAVPSVEWAMAFTWWVSTLQGWGVFTTVVGGLAMYRMARSGLDAAI